MTREFLNKVYDILCQMADAREDDRFGFVESHMDSKYPCREWRFCGSLGFGGKYRIERNTIDCYLEDLTPNRQATIDKVNQALADIKTRQVLSDIKA